MEICQTLRSLNNSHSYDINYLNMNFQTTHAVSLIPLLHHLINLCIRLSVFPSTWKTAQIIPIFKTDYPHNISNYRPIVVISKIMEKLLYNQLNISNSKLLTNWQYAFHPKRSTLSALLLFTEHIRYVLSQGHVTGGVFIYFRKAFDTVNHQVLLKKLISFHFSTCNTTALILSQKQIAGC